ncbi:MAG: zinc-binding dehydrogenase [Bacteroidia bacterium]
MKAIVLTKNGSPQEAFEMRELPIPEPKGGEVLVKSEAFGLNFADVLSRQGLYRDAPELPATIGYEAVGRIEKTGSGTSRLKPGQRVVAFTLFGGYGQYLCTGEEGVAAIPEDMDAGVAVALAAQYCTAWYAAYEMMNLYPGDKVLIHAAAGGVGTALVQLCKRKGCIIFGTASQPQKLTFLKEQGVDYPVNYKEKDFEEEIKHILNGDKLDVVFDSVGGKTFRKSRALLGAGGRIVGYGASSRSGGSDFFGKLKLVFGYGFLHPAMMLMKSQSIIGVYMLPVAERKPAVLQRCLQGVVDLAAKGEISPHVGGRFKATQIAEAHQMLESRNSMGKIVVEW